MKYRLIEEVVSTGNFSETYASTIFDVGSAGGDSISLQANVTNATPSNKTFQAGVKAALVNQSLTYTAVSDGVGGNAITIALVDPGTANASLSVTVVANAITVHLATDSDSIITSTGDLVKAAVNASTPASALVLVSGSNASVVTALSATHLAGGLDSKVDTVTSQVTVTAHGLSLGTAVTLTTAGALPTGLSTSTTYYIIVIDANTVQFASTNAHALSGTFIALTGHGSGVATIVSTALSTATLTLSESNDAVNWTPVASATSITTSATYVIEKDRPTFRYYQYQIALASGVLSSTNYFLVKGDVT